MLNLNKLNESKAVVLNLTKELGIPGQIAQVAVCMDYSGSMNHLYSSGFVQRVLERLVPVAMAFDDNEEMEFYRFSNSVELINSINLNNLDGFVKREVMRGSMGSTEYAPAIKKITEDYTTERSGGVMGMFSGKKTIAKLKYPVLVLFITDGDNDGNDKEPARAAIREASKHGIFFQFVGLGSSSFRFLEELDNLSGREMDNANYFSISESNLDKESDDTLYKKLLVEFPSFINQAVAAGKVR